MELDRLRNEKQKINAKALNAWLKEIGQDPLYAEERDALLAYARGATLSHQLTWSHVVEILKIDDPLERGRILRCFVLIDLKLGEVRYDDIGQRNLYPGYFAHEENIEGDVRIDSVMSFYLGETAANLRQELDSITAYPLVVVLTKNSIRGR